jgi:phage terminase Nu1 subunit (DNA packaging protein)
MDIETVAELLGVSTRQIRTYVNQGMPAGKEGRTPVFNWRDVFDWFVGYKISLEYGDRPDPATLDDEDEDLPAADNPNEDIRKVNLRLSRAKADLAQLELSRRRSEVITIADARTRLDRMMGNLRTKLLSMAPKLASRIEGLKDRTEREGAIKDELENVCREISTGAVVDLPGEASTSTETVEIEAAADFPTNVQILAAVLNAEAYSE